MNTEKVANGLHSPTTLSRKDWTGRQMVASHVQRPLGEHCRILCVDDEIVGTELRGRILEEHGYAVVTHHCPLTALETDLSVFSLAVVDFGMPEVNGRELLLRMRALGARFPIVLLTGSLDALSHEDRVLFARCIDKGRPIQYLLETIEQFLGPNQVPDFST
jgi:CheY-like chemotaxis protein